MYVVAAAMAVFVAASFIDLEHRILPDALTLPWAVVFVAASAAFPGLQAGHWLAGSGSAVGAVAASMAGCLGAVATVAAVRSMGTVIFRKRLHAEGLQEAMGQGDVKFAATLGALLGLPGAWWAFFLAVVAGAVIGVGGILAATIRALPEGGGIGAAWRTGRAQGGVIPFGPFLAAGAAACLLYEHEIHNFLTRDWPHWVAGRLGGG